jgi:hypothetical protein
VTSLIIFGVASNRGGIPNSFYNPAAQAGEGAFMSIIPVTSLSSQDLGHLGNNVLPQARRDRQELGAALSDHPGRAFCTPDDRDRRRS